MSVTGENVNLTLSSSTESPKGPEKIEETPTSGTKRRKGKNHVETSPTEDGVGFRAFCKVAIPDFVPPSCATITRDCYDLFIERRKALKDFFKNLSSRLCLTTDTWTSSQNLSYMCLTSHFIDDAWKFRKMIINFCPIVGHSREIIGRKIEKSLQEWGHKKILTLTVDNVNSNDLAIKWVEKC
ncbi:hypothetical protein V6N13_074010 [Hibiscus sabdariffa]